MEPMEQDLDVSIPLSSLSYEFRTLVSNLLNTRRVITTDGPNKLPRDWRGLAFLLQISSELASSISESPDKTSRLLDIWMQRGDGTATLETLLDYLTQLDRYDIYDDIVELANLGRLIATPIDQSMFGNEISKINGNKNDGMIITYDDRRDGFPHYYHAYVLFAQKDWEFVRELLSRMKALGYKLCTEYDIDVGYGTQYAPVAQLISERCYRIILVYSPDFLVSPANSFYSDYAQAVGIESNKRNIIPIIYRKCTLPHHLMYYHRLVYKPDEWAPYDFWEKLGQTLGKIKLPG
ncbi:myeloid differentiation primary response protein MyD88-A [Ostrinia furnacalis]|uniref:myeloid differentiation primary response protein MyD88-A n=1 Tax=Ostrinia furnacalis TaxID=93504 RepID=UPI00103C8DA7|nr:myeloid differentiation primary response protein MyD88-A [Ostrinia furnacalis]